MPTDFMIARATWPVDLLISRGKWQLDSMISRDALQLDWMISGLLLMWMSVTRSFPLRNFLWSSIHDMFIYYIYIYINISWYLQQSWLTVFKRALPTSRFKSNGIWLYWLSSKSQWAGRAHTCPSLFGGTVYCPFPLGTICYQCWQQQKRVHISSVLLWLAACWWFKQGMHLWF